MMNYTPNVNQISAAQVASQLTNLKMEDILSVADVYYYANFFELKQPLSSQPPPLHDQGTA